MISISILRAKNKDSFDGIILSRTCRIQFIATGTTFADYLIIDRDIWVGVGNDFIDPVKNRLCCDETGWKSIISRS